MQYGSTTFDGSKNSSINVDIPRLPDSIKLSGDATASASLTNGISQLNLITTVNNAATADKLKTARTISLTGDVKGSITFDGSKNVSINTTMSGFSSSTIPGYVPNPYNGGKVYDLDGQMPQTAPGKSSEIYFYDIHYAYIDKTDFSIHYIGHYSYVGAGAGRITTPAGAIVENGITVCEGFMLRLAFMPILTYFLVPWKFMVNYCVSYSIFY